MNKLPQQLIYRNDLDVVFNLKDGTEHELDEIGRLIVDSMVQGVTAQEIARKISNEYDVSEADVHSDIMIFIRGLLGITQSDADEEESQFEAHKSTELVDTRCQFPVNLEIELTRVCNLRCHFCYNVWKTLNGSKNKGSETPLHLTLGMVQKVQEECKKNNLLRIRYSGGEPLLHPQIKEIIENGAQNNLYQVLFTNGTVLDKEKVKLLAENNVHEVLISIHGKRKQHDRMVGKQGGFDAAMKGIEVAMDGGLQVIPEMTLTAKNSDDVAEVIELLSKMGVENFGIMKYVPTGKDDKDYMLDYESFRKILSETFATDMKIVAPCSQRHCFSETDNPIKTQEEMPEETALLYGHCNAGIRWMAIGYDGSMKICPHSRVSFGNIKEHIVKEIWRNRIMPFVVKRISDIISEQCKQCILVNRCKGGCHLDAVNKT